MLTVQEEVQRLLNDMKVAAMNAADPKSLCQTIQLETRVKELSFPDDGHLEPSLISPYAQAIVAREWRKVGNT